MPSAFRPQQMEFPGRQPPQRARNSQQIVWQGQAAQAAHSDFRARVHPLPQPRAVTAAQPSGAESSLICHSRRALQSLNRMKAG